MPNYKLKITYDGTRYSGWEHQPGQETIQGKLEQVLGRMCGLNLAPRDYMKPGAPIKLIGAGRTDAGVHARAMIASVELDTPAYIPGPWERRKPKYLREESAQPLAAKTARVKPASGGNGPAASKPAFRSGVIRRRRMTCDEMRDYMNHYLPDDIAVIEFTEAAPRFHARYKATGKTYQYTAFDGPVRPVFNRRYYTYVEEELDVEAMQKAAAYLIGEHDFRSFCGNPKMKKSTVRTVDTIEIRRSKGYVCFTFHGSGFLQNMVRILVGTLMEVGHHRMEPEQVAKILEARDRSIAGPTAPAKGLCMMRVDYD